MTTILCVYSKSKTRRRKQREFTANHVVRLLWQIRQHTPDVASFMCLTNNADDLQGHNITTIPLKKEWPDYWCKMEALKIAGPCLYIDLDVTILGDLTPLLDAASRYRFVAIRSVKEPSTINSSVMSWNGDLSGLYRTFAHEPDKFMKRYRKGTGLGHNVGDQGFINEHVGDNGCRWDEILPGAIRSYKLEWVHSKNPECRIVYFHGKPRPWDLPELDGQS